MERAIVVIGAGPSGAGTNWGPLIDSQFAVVRMWNHDWQPVEHYGSRYDYGFITSTEFVEQASRSPTLAWLFYNVPHDPMVSEIDGTPVITVDNERWYDRAIEEGAWTEKKRLKFTRGFAAVAGSIEILRPSRVVIIGMDVLRDGYTTSPYYDPAALPYYMKLYPRMARRPSYAMDKMEEGLLREGPHDFSVEAKLIRMLASEAGTELAWGF